MTQLLKKYVHCNPEVSLNVFSRSENGFCGQAKCFDLNFFINKGNFSLDGPAMQEKSSQPVICPVFGP